MTTIPEVDLLFLGAALVATPRERDEPLALVVDCDLGDPHAAAVLGVLREMCCTRRETDATAVCAELIRRGAPLPQHAVLRNAVAVGACGAACREYGAMVVAGALRRHLDSAGRALQELAATGGEDDLIAVMEKSHRAARSIRQRLARLRGDQS